MKIKIDPLDKIFSLYVRTKAGWLCERCGKQFKSGDRGLHCSHFHGRRKKSVRWDAMNAAALCFSCHQRFTEHPLEHVEWFKKRLGQKKFDALTIQANTPKKIDKSILELAYKSILKEVV